MSLSFQFSAMAMSAFALISTAAAAPTGNLSIANVTNGGVVVSAGRIDWYPPTNSSGPGGFGDFSTGGATNITFDAGTVTATTNPYGQIKDIVAGTGPISDFIQFYSGLTLPTPPGTGALSPYPVFDLVSVAAGGSAQGALDSCTGVTQVGVACSPLITAGGTPVISPFVLTNRGAYTDVSLGVNLIGRDSSGSTPWAGGFTSQVISQNGIRLTPDAIQSVINSGQSITNTYSATFSGSAVPEPGSMALMGTGLLLVSVLRRRYAR